MFDTCSCLAVLVAYRTWPWTAVAVSSFQEWFPDLPLLVVDNNPADVDSAVLENCRRERQWLAQRSNLEFLMNSGHERFHGSGIDLALRHCRERHVEFLVHFEPDCLILGRQWLERLLLPLRCGAWMSGMWRHFYGPLHPTPSVWRVDIGWDTFSHQLRRDDVDHPRFGEVFRLQELLEHARVHEPQVIGFWESYWDTSQRNWFLAAVQDRAAMVEPTADFRHFWFGSRRGPDPEDQSLARYLRETGTFSA
jgi:hypothetical protein